LHDRVILAEVKRIPGSILQYLRGDLLQGLDRIMDALLPQRPVEHLKEHPGRGVPAPPEVIGKIPKTGDSFRQFRYPEFRSLYSLTHPGPYPLYQNSPCGNCRHP
jgi:hypothetical protein